MMLTDELAEFAAATSARLRRTAFLLSGDWHMAEDLAQATLAKLFIRWRPISRRDVAGGRCSATPPRTSACPMACSARSPEMRSGLISAAAVTPPTHRMEVTPIATASNRPAAAIIVGSDRVAWNSPVAMTPDGQTLYSGTRNGVIPFSTATKTPGKPISFGSAVVMGIAITPDASTADVHRSRPPP